MERKVKYDYAFKLECVKLVIEKHQSYGVVSKQKGADKSNIRKWVGFYKQFGESGLIPRMRCSYSVDFKLKVLQSIDKELLSLNETCLKFNIPTSSVFLKWKRDFANFGLQGLQPKEKGKSKSMDNIRRKKRKSDKPLTREEELLLENEALRCENDLLKKLQALIQAEEKSQKAQAIMELRHQYDLELLLNQTNMARSSFYYHQKQYKSSDKYQVVKELIKSIYHKHKGRYGYRRITDDLNNKGVIINHKQF